MRKNIITALAIALPALGAMAVVPGEEYPSTSKHAPQFVNHFSGLANEARMAGTKGAGVNENSFFEGFEGREPSAFGNVANRWLPSGWSEFSRKGNAHVGNNDALWDLTWLTLSNETMGSIPTMFATSAYSGDCFAYIMCDVMWAEKEGPNKEQDEWLVTPTMTPAENEWFYFKLQFRPGWCLYNRDKKDFSGETNLLEVYVTEGNGSSDSDWKLLWSLKDYIKANYSEEDLSADLSRFDRPDYVPIYVRMADYVGKDVHLAFRYYGVDGQGMALDDVSLGIPYPKPSYQIPAGFYKQQSLTPTMDEIDGDYRLLVPFGTEATWVNTSEDILTSEWTYATADGTVSKLETKNLTTPAYDFGQTYPTPLITGKFENRSADYQSAYSLMQAGGRLYGKGKMGYDGPLGVAHYDFLDPKGTLAISSNTIALTSDINESWETLLGRLPNSLDILGIGCLYPSTAEPFGFDYVDVTAKVSGDADGKLSENTAFVLTVFRLPENEYDESAAVIGQTMLTGAEINASEVIEVGNYKNLRFKLDVPVTSSGDILVLISPYNIESGDGIAIPYMKSTDDKVWGNSVMYMYVYEAEENGGTYDTFYNLNAFPMSQGHFAGLLMSLGASYSYMEALNGADADIELPYTGGTHTLDIRAMHSPDTWAVTADGVTKADWVSLQAKPTAGDVYSTTLTFAENESGDPREMDIYVAQAGSRVKLHVVQAKNPNANLGIDDVSSASMRVSIEGSNIRIEGVDGLVEVFNSAGSAVASAKVSGTALLPASHLGKGVYIVRTAHATAKIVL